MYQIPCKLGVMLHETMDDSIDMMRHRKYLYGKGNLLVRHFLSCSEDVKIRLFKTYCNNIYGGHLWSQYRASDMKKLQVAFNDIYRLLFGIHRGESMSHIYVLHNIASFNVLLRKAIFSFQKRLLDSDNAYISTILKSVYFHAYSATSRHWSLSLYSLLWYILHVILYGYMCFTSTLYVINLFMDVLVWNKAK